MLGCRRSVITVPVSLACQFLSPPFFHSPFFSLPFFLTILFFSNHFSLKPLSNLTPYIFQHSLQPLFISFFFFRAQVIPSFIPSPIFLPSPYTLIVQGEQFVLSLAASEFVSVLSLTHLRVLFCPSFLLSSFSVKSLPFPTLFVYFHDDRDHFSNRSYQPYRQVRAWLDVSIMP